MLFSVPFIKILAAFDPQSLTVEASGLWKEVPLLSANNVWMTKHRIIGLENKISKRGLQYADPCVCKPTTLGNCLCYLTHSIRTS